MFVNHRNQPSVEIRLVSTNMYVHDSVGFVAILAHAIEQA
jgi:hypothetical protein